MGDIAERPAPGIRGSRCPLMEKRLNPCPFTGPEDSAGSGSEPAGSRVTLMRSYEFMVRPRYLLSVDRDAAGFQASRSQHEEQSGTVQVPHARVRASPCTHPPPGRISSSTPRLQQTRIRRHTMNRLYTTRSLRNRCTAQQILMRAAARSPEPGTPSCLSPLVSAREQARPFPPAIPPSALSRPADGMILRPGFLVPPFPVTLTRLPGDMAEGDR